MLLQICWMDSGAGAFQNDMTSLENKDAITRTNNFHIDKCRQKIYSKGNQDY